MTDKYIRPLPTQQRLHELFYCVGGQLIRKIRPSHNSKTHIGDVCNTMNKRGYYVVRVDSVQYRVHRLVWKWYYGVDPEYILDHIDRDRTNNNIWNLRESDDKQNSYNNKITMDKHGGKLLSETINGKRVLTDYGRQKITKYNTEYQREYRQRKRQG